MSFAIGLKTDNVLGMKSFCQEMGSKGTHSDPDGPIQG